MLRIGFMASYNGSGMRSVLQAITEGLPLEPTLLIANNPDAGAFETAKHYQLPSQHLSHKTHPDESRLDQAISDYFVQYDTDLILLSGYMKKLGPITLTQFEGRILNIHPSLLPKFGGQGMYGDRVHQAVLDQQEPESGASVHIVSAEYDQGPIINQQAVALGDEKSLESIRNKVRHIESYLYVDTLEKILAGQIQLDKLDQ